MQDIQGFLERIPRSALIGDGHRGLVVLAGTLAWCQKIASDYISRRQDVLSLGESAPTDAKGAYFPNAKPDEILGREYSTVVFDAHTGFDADLFAASSGTLRAGGLFLLLTPALTAWPDMPDRQVTRLVDRPENVARAHPRFKRRFVAKLRQFPGVTVLEENAPPPEWQLPEPLDTSVFTPNLPTQDQLDTIEAIDHVARGHRRRPLLVVSDRGRGKSSALGLAAGRLMLQTEKRIVVTAPRFDAVAHVFQHAAETLGLQWEHESTLGIGNSRLAFCAPDELLARNVGADLLLVDEAAAIPVPMLQKFVDRYSRIVFASTVHGYEGSGRGFGLRFSEYLNVHTPGWKKISLEVPIRWAANDPLEAFVFDALMLNAEPNTAKNTLPFDLNAIRIEEIQREALLNDEDTLAQVFGLLVTAHYRTRPFDLRQLMDAPDIRLFAAYEGDSVIGVCVVMEEGQIEDDLREPIYYGSRRLRGHLLPQSLANHCGIRHATALRYWRIMRIAVNTARRDKGVGTALSKQVQRSAKAAGVDCIGVSYGGNQQLYRFWSRSGMLPVRVGLTREHTSGEHAVICLKGFTIEGESLVTHARQRFKETFDFELSRSYRDLDPLFIVVLLTTRNESLKVSAQRSLSHDDRDDIHSYIHGNRQYEVVQLSLFRLVEHCIQSGMLFALPERNQRILVAKVMQGIDWPEIVVRYDFHGKHAAQSYFRSIVSQLWTFLPAV